MPERVALKVNGESVPILEERDEPALYATTSTTMPVLTSSLFAFTLAALAIPRDAKDEPLFSAAMGELAPIGLVGGAALFLYATVSCLRAHAWDFTAMSDAYLELHRLPRTPAYQERCRTNQRSWHAVAVYCYRAGLCLALTGFSGQIWPTSEVAGVLLLVMASGFVVEIVTVAIIRRVRKCAHGKLRRVQEAQRLARAAAERTIASPPEAPSEAKRE